MYYPAITCDDFMLSLLHNGPTAWRAFPPAMLKAGMLMITD